MFDPSKLNLDLDNLDKDESTKNQSQQNKNTKTNNQQKEETKETKTSKNDILEEINIKQKTKENTTIKKNSEDIATTSEINSSKENILKEINTEEKNNKTEIKEEKAKISETTKIEKKEEKKIIFDINLNSAEALISYLIKNKYDFFTIEPEENKVKINFFKDKILKETKYIKYPTYSQILIKLKTLTKLKIEETDKSQEGSWEVILWGKNYKILSKTAPTNFWEKIFIKAIPTTKKVKKETKKTSIWTIFGFLWAIIFIALILGGAFISFIVMHAKTVEDVKFFYRLWINLNDINNFIETAVSIIFSIIVLLEVIVLIIFLFKFLFTKKDYKKKRIARWIISFFVLLITFSTVSGWMILDKKIRSLPNWQELAYWNIQILDNDLLKKSDIFNREAALLTKTTNLIGPINIKFDLTNFAKSEQEKWIKINKYKWSFNWEDEIITLEPTLIHKFDKIWTYKINLVLEEIDLHWDTIDKVVENIPSIEISHLIKIDEEKLDNWGKIVKFDASDLKNLWKVDWYFITDINDANIKPVFTGYKFNPAKVIFEDTIIWLQIQKPERKNDNLDKIFIIEATKQTDIKAKIEIKQDPINDLLYTFKVADINLEFGNWFIEQFKWKIDNTKTKTIKANIDDIEKSSIIKIPFKKYGKHKIKVELIDSNWNKKILEKEFEIKKHIKLKKSLEFYKNNKPLKVEYKDTTNEYFIKNLKVPTTIEINAKNVESDNILDYLKEVEWDINWDWDIDEKWKTLNYEIKKWWYYQVNVIYTFQNKRIKKQITKLKEIIYIDAQKSAVLLDLQIKKSRDYVPIKVAFDASNSYIKWKDISKFIFDYGDWTPPDVRDAKNPGHKYIKPWDYTVKLTVVTTDWKEYSIEKKLILKPEPQKAEITASMKKAPIYTPIDFSSNKSSWEIVNYFWDFGDGKTSTEANPSHMYKKPWTYKVKLTLDYKNKNTLSDEVEIIITDE